MKERSAPANARTLEEALARVLAGFQPDPSISAPPAAQKAARLARQLLERAAELQTPAEKKQQAELERMMDTPSDKATLMQLTDQAFRSTSSHRAVDQLTHILDVQGVPRFFSPLDRTLLRGFQSFGGFLPGVAVPLVKSKMREETANVILPAEPELLAEHLEARRQDGVRMNLNYLGEALLGEGEAERRLEVYLDALRNPAVECLSVKISTIYSQISSLALEETVAVLSDRMELLYRAAARARFRRADGQEVPKFVYLDMEEYRDLAVTTEVFLRTLDRPGLERVAAGIALQAYIPDSHDVQRRILQWARERVAKGGEPPTIRLVKGANMEMERVEASIRGWPQAPFQRKVETDANYKRMLHEAFREENRGAIRLGIASHNLFDIAYGLVLAVEARALEHVQFEMLEGMANHQRRALFELTRSMLLYAPATRREDFLHAIGYLIRRLDENTGEENFLRHTFKLTVDSEEWRVLERGFYESFEPIERLPDGPRRTQDRNAPAARSLSEGTFVNEPDTDFSLPQNVAWAREIVARWIDRHGERAAEIPLVIAGEEILDRPVRESFDPSRPRTVVARYRQAREEDIERAVAVARADPAGWRSRPVEARSEILGRVARKLRGKRGDLIGVALADGGKTMLQSDPEISEAIDFCEYYRRSAHEWSEVEGLRARAKGVVAVIPPWNFPIAIPCGGVAAALAAGNTVLLKPASDTVLVAWELCRAFWDGGVPREALQFVPCAGGTVGAKLVAHPEVDVVVLTGGTDTALSMLDARPDLELYAETGGKNATIVTALSDREQAVKHVLYSAFGHSGQKCSATSLLILEDEVYEDESFRRMLVDAARSLQVGSAWDLDTSVGPLIRAPSGDLERALKELEPGESWALRPRQVDGNPCLWSPGIKWGVEPGSVTHLTEFFGPVLGVLRARNLDDAIALVHQTGYGLTSGLESLDDREQTEWLARVRAGNLYVNRVTTGAVVLRQPFGGMGKSAFGPGIKAGGPNYVAQLLALEPEGEARQCEAFELAELSDLVERLRAEDDYIATRISAADIEAIVAAIRSFDVAMREEFGREHDSFRLLGQDNIRRYLAVDELRIRLHADDTAFELLTRVAAARAVGSRITVSVPTRASKTAPALGDSPLVEALDYLTESWGARLEIVEESDAELADVIRERYTERVRYAARDRVPEEIRRAVGDSGVYIASAPVLGVGRAELLWYLREQSISRDYHRYGNLGTRLGERRAQVL